MDLELIERLVRLLENSQLDQLEVEEEGFRVKLQKHGPMPAVPPPVVSFGGAPSAPQTAPAPPAAELTVIEAPMVGTFYRSPAPDAAPYVQPGDVVNEDTIVCIVEAMKVMNEIKAGVRGKIVEVLVENAQPVEFGQPLFRVNPSGV